MKDLDRENDNLNNCSQNQDQKQEEKKFCVLTVNVQQLMGLNVKGFVLRIVIIKLFGN